MDKRRFGLCATGMLGALFILCLSFAPAEASGIKVEVQVLEGRVKAAPDSPGLWLELGYARLKAGDLKGAEKAFLTAETKGEDEIDARAYNGLGLVYAAKPRQLQAAVDYFQKALRKQPDYAEAHFNKAQTYYLHNWMSHAIQAAKDALAADSTNVAAQQLIDKCRAITAGDVEKSKKMYEKYLTSDPEDLEGWSEWGGLAVAEGNYDQILTRLPDVIRKKPEWRDLYPIVAQAFWKKNLLDQAWIGFSKYVEGLEEEERVLYEDVSLIMWGDEARRFQRASAEERRAIAARFWEERDPDYNTPINERLLEHYRRVWYARTYFSRYKQPWDRRGEVYIRYGEPDHRSRSKQPSPPPSTSVNAVKERFFNMLYRDHYILLAMGGGSEIPYLDPLEIDEGLLPEDQAILMETEGGLYQEGTTMTGVQWFDAVTGGLTGSLVGPVFPIRSYDPGAVFGLYLPVGASDFSLVPWESWTYTGVDGGIVIDFTRESGKMGFDYAPIPELGKTPGLRHGTQAGIDDIRAMNAFTRRAPISIARRAFAAVPDRYMVSYEDFPLDFYFDEARFQGQADAVRVEVYYGVPMSEATYSPTDSATGLRAACRIALVRKADGKVYRSGNELAYLEPGDRTGGTGFIPHAVSVNVPPGEYTLDVRMEDRLKGEAGAYRKQVTVESYPAGPLKLSDIQLAWKVSAGDEPGPFSKNGLKVVPMPTRLYKKGQPVFIYYEIYNLKRNAFGMTSYTVEYTIRSGKPPGAISRIFRAFRDEEPGEEVAVEQEQLGRQETQPSYIELDLNEVVPGQVVLTVSVKDLNSDETASSEAKFEIKE